MRNIYCIGRNYVDHAKELGNEIPSTPVVFSVVESSVRSFQKSDIAFENETFHYEGELVLKIGSDHKLNSHYTQESISHIAFGIDLTRRRVQADLKSRGLPWLLSKSFKGSSIIGDWYDKNIFEDLNNIDFNFTLNDKIVQSANVNQMLFSFENIIDYINTFSPLLKGDLIFTGTPAGVGEIIKGDNFSFSFPVLNISENGVL